MIKKISKLGYFSKTAEIFRSINQPKTCQNFNFCFIKIRAQRLTYIQWLSSRQEDVSWPATLCSHDPYMCHLRLQIICKKSYTTLRRDFDIWIIQTYLRELWFLHEMYRLFLTKFCIPILKGQTCIINKSRIRPLMKLKPRISTR